MALTKRENKVVADHREKFGAGHASTMRKEIEKGRTVSQAHKTAVVAVYAVEIVTIVETEEAAKRVSPATIDPLGVAA